MVNDGDNNTEGPPEFLRIRDTPIYFQEDWATGIGGGLWSTGLALAQYLNSSHASQQLERLYRQKQCRPLNMLELGSGNGLLAACWLALGKDKIRNLVITDTTEHLPLIQRTMEANPHLSTNDTTSRETKNTPSPNVLILEHNWGEFADVEVNNNEAVDSGPLTMVDCISKGENCDLDVIVGSDVAYHQDLYDPLICSLLRFTEKDWRKPPTVILLGCTMSDTTPEFFDRLRNKGFVYQRLADHLLDPKYQGRIFGVFVVQRRETRF